MGGGTVQSGSYPDPFWKQPPRTPDPEPVAKPAAKPPAVVVARQPAGLSLPASDEGGPIPYVIGTIRADSNILWYGNQRTLTRYDKTVIAGTPGATTLTPIYTDVVDIQFGICTGPDVHLIGIYGQNNFPIWTGNLGSGVTVFTPAIADGIFSGKCTWYSGQFDQPVNAVMAASVIDTTPLPAFVGLAYVFVEQGDRTNNYALSFEVRRMPNPLGLDPAVNVSADGADINLATMVVDFMTASWNGGGQDISIFDTSSFIAAASVLASEGNFGSVAINDENVSADDLIQMIEAQADGTIFVHPSTGLITFRLFREDLVNLDDPTIPVFSDNIQDHPDFSKTGWDNAVNQVRVMYSERTSGYRQVPAIAQTIEVASTGGRTRQSKQATYPLACTGTLGNKLAARDLAAASSPRYSQTITTDRRGAYLVPGDVIKVNWSNYQQAETPFFVQKRRDLPKSDNLVVLDLMQFSAQSSAALFPPPEENGYNFENQESVSPTDVRVIDAPYFFAKKFSPQLFTPYDHVSVPLFLTRPAGRYQTNALVKWDLDYPNDADGAYLIGGTTYLPYAAVGTLASDIDEFEGITTGNTDSITITGIFTTLYGPPLISGVIQYVFINDEIFAAGGMTLIGTTLTISSMARAMCGTVKMHHPVGSTVHILIGPNTIISQDTTTATYTPDVSFPDDGSVSPYPEFQFTGRARAEGKNKSESLVPLRHVHYEAYEPGVRLINPLGPHATKITGHARSSTPVSLTRGASGNVSWRTRSRWYMGVTLGYYGRPQDKDNPSYWGRAMDYAFSDVSLISEYDSSNNKFAQHRVMIKDSANVVWNLGSTDPTHFDDTDLDVVWPAGAATGAGLLWVEQYNDYGDSSRYKDTLPITLV